MRATARLGGMRQLAESRMTSRCTIRRATGRGAQNEATGRQTPTWQVTYSSLPIRVGGSRDAAQTRREDVSGVELQTALRIAHLPHDTSNLRDGDLIEITSGENTGIVLRIVEATWQDQATARRLPVEQVTRPREW